MFRTRPMAEYPPDYDQMSYEERREVRRRLRWQREVERAARRPGESAVAHFLRVWLRGGLLRAGRRIRPAMNAYFGRHSTIGDTPYFEAEQFDWAPALESRFEEIRKEAEMVLTARDRLPPLHWISPDHSRIDADDDKWKVYFLKGYGIPIEEHCRQCPNTWDAVRRIPGLESAFFSILEAGKRIPRHRGPSRTIFTAHLGLMVPSDAKRCFLRVDGVSRRWQEGRLLFFDDTFKHQVWNDTDEDRVVLLLHVRRPMRFPASLVRDALFTAIQWSPFVRDGVRNQRRWEERLARAEGQRDPS